MIKMLKIGAPMLALIAYGVWMNRLGADSVRAAWAADRAMMTQVHLDQLKSSKEASDKLQRESEAKAKDVGEVEVQIVERIRVVEREIPRVIEKIVEVKPECASLPELGRLFTAQAQAANNQSGHGEGPTEP